MLDDMASYIGFPALTAKLMAAGKSRGRAAAIASSIGRKKYGKRKFQAAAKAGRKMGHK